MSATAAAAAAKFNGSSACIVFLFNTPLHLLWQHRAIPCSSGPSSDRPGPVQLRHTLRHRVRPSCIQRVSRQYLHVWKIAVSNFAPAAIHVVETTESIGAWHICAVASRVISISFGRRNRNETDPLIRSPVRTSSNLGGSVKINIFSQLENIDNLCLLAYNNDLKFNVHHKLITWIMLQGRLVKRLVKLSFLLIIM